MVRSITTPTRSPRLRRGQSFAWGPDMSGSVGGAGGIGGLAVSMEDNSSAPGYGAGPMVPVYDGHGNITRLYTIDFPSFAMASYEYGPFGEVRSITGTQGHRNPFRWSTKWTDAETGLVYYGYRYYAPGMGRWVSRDRASELGGLNLHGLTSNSPITYVDPLGLWIHDNNWSYSDRYSGTATAECGDTFATLARYITNHASDAHFLPYDGTPVAGQSYEIGELLQRLEDRLRRSVVRSTSVFQRAADAYDRAHATINNSNPSFGPAIFWRALKENDIRAYAGSGFTPIDCKGAAVVVLGMGLLENLNKGEFDQIFKQLGDAGIRERTVDSAAATHPGDWVYFVGHESYQGWYNANGGRGLGPWQGENAINVGGGQFWGFPGGVKSEQDWKEALREAAAALAPPGTVVSIGGVGGFDKKVKFFDSIFVGTATFKERRRVDKGK